MRSPFVRPVTVTLLFFLSAPWLTASAAATILHITIEADWHARVGPSSLAGFDEFAGPIGDQYPGVHFHPNCGGSPYSDQQAMPNPPCSPPRFMATRPWAHGGGGWAADFDPPVSAVAFCTFDVVYGGSSVRLLDAEGIVLGEFGIGFCGEWGWCFEGFVSTDAQIARIEVCVNALDHVAFDSVRFASALPCVGDVTGDGQTDLADLALLLANFGANVPVGTLGDLNSDGLVDLGDLAMLLSDFGCTQ